MIAVVTQEGAMNAWRTKLAANPLLPLISPFAEETPSSTLLGVAHTSGCKPTCSAHVEEMEADEQAAAGQ